MATGIGNTVGYVPLVDGENPRIITGYAREVLSGGVFAFGSSVADTVSSGLDSFATSDLQFSSDASGAAFNGVVVNTTASGAEVAIARQVTILALAAGTVTAGHKVGCDGVNGVHNTGSFALDAQGATIDRTIGRALTTATSGNYAVVDILG